MAGQQSYLIVEPDRPTPEEYARGARLIPSMLDEGVRVWRVPAEQIVVSSSGGVEVMPQRVDGIRAVHSTATALARDSI